MKARLTRNSWCPCFHLLGPRIPGACHHPRTVGACHHANLLLFFGQTGSASWSSKISSVFPATTNSCCQQRKKETPRKGNLRLVCLVPQTASSLWERAWASKTSSCGWQHGAKDRNQMFLRDKAAISSLGCPGNSQLRADLRRAYGQGSQLASSLRQSQTGKVKADLANPERHHRCQAKMSSDMVQGAQSTVKEARLLQVWTQINRL